MTYGRRAMILAAGLSLPFAAMAQAPTTAASRPVIAGVADIPRFSYPVSGHVERFVDNPQELAPLVARMKSDIEGVLTRYQINDRATLAQFQSMLRNIAVFQNDREGFARANGLYREYLDRPALKMWTGTVDTARFAAMGGAAPGSAAFTQAFSSNLATSLDQLDWNVTGQTVKERYRSRALASPGLRRAALIEGLQPTIDASGTLDMPSLDNLLANVNDVVRMIPLADAERAAEKAWIDRHDHPKPDIWAKRDLALDNRGLTPVTIGIWDSGVDAGVFPGIVWTNPGEVPNGKDDDGNGYVDDIHGIAVDEYGRHVPQTLLPVPPELKGNFDKIALVMRGETELQAGLDTPATADTIHLFRTSSAADLQPILAGLQWYDEYAHGTHVTGIAVKGNPAARVVVARTSFDWRSPPRRPTEQTARAFAQADHDAVNYFKAHGVRVVNMSWGVGLKDEYENQLLANGLAPAEALAEGKRLFAIERQGLYDAMAGAPGILFVVAAGNDNDSADFSGIAPSSFNLPNVLVVAAVDQAGEPTNFTTNGSTVAIAASGYQVESFIPGGARLRFSGTSMASPQVTNAAAKLFALKPSLTVAQARAALLASATPGAGGFKLLDTGAAVRSIAAGRAN